MALYRPGLRFSSPTTFSPIERLVLVGAAILLLVSVIGWLWQRRQATSSNASRGGTYVEGIINDSPAKIERLVSRLTNIGLTYRDSDNTLKPALAESWTVSTDGKVYAFKIRGGYTADQLVSIIQNTKTDWRGIDVSAPDGTTLLFKLPEALNSFLATTTSQIFPYGPYELVKRDKKDIIFRVNSRWPLDAPYIEKIEVRAYETLDQLTKAAESNEIDGSADLSRSPANSWREYTVSLPRYYVLFFNTTRPAFKKEADRARIINAADGPAVKYTLVTTQSTTSSDLADSLATTLTAKHITFDIQKKNSATFQKDELGKRDYDLLLYGIDYGPFRDYYPFWHSSQAVPPGLNVSGYKDKELDKLLEQARRANDTEHEVLNRQIEDMLQAKNLQKIVSPETTKFWVKKSIHAIGYGTIDEASDRFSLVWRWYIR